MRMPLVAGLVVTLAVSAGIAADAPSLPPVPRLTPPDTALPIDLDAAFSEFDRRNDRLIFRQLNITQGTLRIKADEATADPADFANSVWVFVGNVSIRNADTQASSDRAELTFRDNQLRKAVLTGQPARFSQAGAGGKPPTEGHGQRLEYDLDTATIELVNDAFLSDGKNEVSGNRIAYDLRREVVTAGTTEGGQVRMRITPQRTNPATTPKTAPDTPPDTEAAP
jgi:lipopolysaccharide export system protein LptA